MTKEASVALPEGKYVSGYFNGNRWPIQLVISRLNVTLHLQPGDFILDKQGRKINDPFFELYAKSGQLSRELSDKPVATISVPTVTATVAPAIHDGQSVRAVTEFMTDAKGVKRPVIPQPQALPPQSINKPSYVGMTMDEARRAGLIKKVREVPEEFGVPDNSAAMPPRTAPTIKYALDTDQAAKPKADLPQQLATAIPKQQAAERKQMQTALAAGEKTTELLDSETGFLNVATQNIPAAAGITAGTPAPQEPETVQEAATESASANVIEAPLPSPNLGEDEVLPAPPEEEEIPIPEPQVKPVRVPPRVKFVCAECGQSFKMRPELVGHAKKEHPERMNAILASYPG